MAGLARNTQTSLSTHLPGRILAPGFVDMHIHFPQTDVIGSPADGLLPWLENYTFPHEKRFAAPDYSAQVAQFFIAELLRNGVTTALAFSTSHPASVNALFTEAQRQQMRLITGKVLQDRHSPDGVRDDTEQSLIDTEALIQRWHGVDRLGYAITPRFAPTSTPAQLRGAGSWRRATPMCGSSRMWPRTWMKSAGRASCSRARAATWRVRRLWPDARACRVCPLHPL
jgi:cytosine/adenosine deaminase-related metal-dependent hydrolase